ncbi:hypothetical protein ACFYNY_20690 [Streptomyces sp. NPDC006530]|uniref:hypothetical protein n=1 Tax=Streptomyces sp. NPDC006530 TaxID=3364750 RepID=UPI003687A734
MRVVANYLDHSHERAPGGGRRDHNSVGIDAGKKTVDRERGIIITDALALLPARSAAARGECLGAGRAFGRQHQMRVQTTQLAVNRASSSWIRVGTAAMAL